MIGRSAHFLFFLILTSGCVTTITSTDSLSTPTATYTGIPPPQVTPTPSLMPAEIRSYGGSAFLGTYKEMLASTVVTIGDEESIAFGLASATIPRPPGERWTGNPTNILRYITYDESDWCRTYPGSEGEYIQEVDQGVSEERGWYIPDLTRIDLSNGVGFNVDFGEVSSDAGIAFGDTLGDAWEGFLEISFEFWDSGRIKFIASDASKYPYEMFCPFIDEFLVEKYGDEKKIQIQIVPIDIGGTYIGILAEKYLLFFHPVLSHRF